LLVRLRLAEEDPNTPRALAGTFAVLADHAIAALDSVREIAHGIYPRPLAKFGLREALRPRAARAAVDVSLAGTAPRSTEEAEEAAYFSCSEAIQNAAKHADHRARVTLRPHHDHGWLAVRIADDGPGFEPSRVRDGAGLGNIRDRVEDLGGIFKVASDPGHGTVLTISMPWPARADRRR
jgi:signal transduction histidine kinase